ncbi:uncharacterized protein LOC113388218 [Ctenocephalides felis]|uniref:uncharacterized protein LOC113388218 n=1 Tax=Ctenocephalides felis TaxID=7515 RepID=UPI000E6E4707|nr:uncharacterized protein LOC113388218 [Ctenocephalides felis]
MRIGLSLTETYNKTRKLSIFFAIVIIWMYSSYIFTTQIIVRLYGIYPRASLWFSFVFPNIVSTMIILQFSFYVYILTLRMGLIKTLINNLEIISTSAWLDGDEKRHTMKQKKYATIIDVIGKLHEKLCEIVDHINAYFNNQMLVLCLDAFVMIVFFAYYSLISIMDYEADLAKYIGVMTFFLCPFIANICQMICLVVFCAQFYNEITNCHKKLLVLINESEKRCTKLRLSQLSIQIIIRSPKFSAGGVFILKPTLLRSV